jgi:hypothetical protein
MPRIPPDQCSPYGRPDDDVSALDIWLSFDDLRRAGIVDSRKTLRDWQRDRRVRFPLGKLLAPNTRRWNKAREIDPWLASRPVERAAFDDAEREPDAELHGESMS